MACGLIGIEGETVHWFSLSYKCDTTNGIAALISFWIEVVVTSVKLFDVEINFFP